MNRHLYDEEALMKDYPLAARTAHPEGTVIPVGSAAIGGENLTPHCRAVRRGKPGAAVCHRGRGKGRRGHHPAGRHL